MPISPEERKRWESQVRSLREAETDDEPTPERRAQLIGFLNQIRARNGEPPVPIDEHPSELEFYERVRALGMARTNRRSA